MLPSNDLLSEQFMRTSVRDARSRRRCENAPNKMKGYHTRANPPQARSRLFSSPSNALASEFVYSLRLAW